MDLFDYMRSNTMEKEAPLASRLRPRTLEEVVGQQEIIGERASCFTVPSKPTNWALSFSTDHLEQGRPHWQR